MADIVVTPGPVAGPGRPAEPAAEPRRPALSPMAPVSQEPEAPRRLESRTIDDYVSFLGAGLGSLALVWLLYDNLLPTAGKIGFCVLWFVAFVGLYAIVLSFNHPRPVLVDKVIGSLVHVAAAIVGAALLWTIIYVLYRGWQPLTHLNFFTQTGANAGPTSPLIQGGIANALVGTLVEVGLAVVISVPAGIGAAIYMTEVGGRLSRVVRTVVEAMTALPDLVAGLFIYFFIIVFFARFHWAATTFASKNGLAAALALSITMMPIIARSSEVVLRVVPSGLREAGLALGSSQWSTVWRVVLPTARPGLATAVILGIARGIGETAPVLIVSAPNSFMQVNPIGNPMNSLPLYAYTSIRNGISPQTIERGFGAAAVLLLLVIILFIVIRLLARSRASGR